MGGSHMTLSVAMSMTTMATMLSVMLWVMGMSESLNHSIEAAVRSCFVFDYSDCPIGLLEGVGSLHVVTVSVFMLLFDIAGVRVVHWISEIVFCWTLNEHSYYLFAKFSFLKWLFCLLTSLDPEYCTKGFIVWK